MDHIDRELESLLSVEPSAEFRARVRTRIASEPAPSSWYLHWRVAGVGVAAAAVALALVVDRGTPTSGRARKAGPPAVGGTTLPSTALAVPPIPVTAPRSSAAAIDRVTRPVGAPKVIVAASEMRGLRQLAAIVHEGRVRFVFPDEHALAVPQEPVRDIVVAPIVVAPIEVSSNAEPVGNTEGDEQ